MKSEYPFAVVIEPNAELAATVTDALEARGFEVVAAATHVGAAEMVVDRAVSTSWLLPCRRPAKTRQGPISSGPDERTRGWR